MQITRDTASIHALIRSTTDTELQALMAAHIERLALYEGIHLGEMIRLIVFEKGDSPADLDAALGFPVMTNRFDGTRSGDPDFQPCWEIIERHTHWFEWVYVLSDDGAGVVVFMPVDADNDLIPMLTRYTCL